MTGSSSRSLDDPTSAHNLAKLDKEPYLSRISRILPGILQFFLQIKSKLL